MPSFPSADTPPLLLVLLVPLSVFGVGDVGPGDTGVDEVENEVEDTVYSMISLCKSYKGGRFRLTLVVTCLLFKLQYCPVKLPVVITHSLLSLKMFKKYPSGE